MHLRVWSAPFAEDLDAPSRRGRAYRFSHTQIARRVLLAAGERLGLLTNGLELRLLISDPARMDSQIEIPIDPYWKRSRDVPDSYALLLALAAPSGVRALPEIVEKARLQQTKVTKELRRQAREAVERFVQEILDHPENRERLAAYPNRERLARALWHEGLITIYRLLFIFKLESSDDPARAFSFASTSLWRNSFSPTTALARQVKAVLEEGQESGRLLEDGLRTLFRLFTPGMSCTELRIEPLGGALFGEEATPVLVHLRWGERAAAHLLDRLLWTPRGRGMNARERVHYGTLDVEDLGRVYEALLELEPGITRETMCRLRRRKLEVVVPLDQGERYRPAAPTASEVNEPDLYKVAEELDEEADEVEEDQAPYGGRQSSVEWIEEIPPGCFYLRVGLGRKASGSYYTPHSFVRFLIRETLGPQVAECCPSDDPHPAALLKIKVLDPAMGSGHFLVEACRFLGANLYEACRSCDERILAAEKAAEQAKTKELRERAQAEAAEYSRRLLAIPDPDQTLIAYLPSHAPEGEESGLSQKRAEALCRRLAAVHCLYGVDKNPLAVELAKLSVWLESHAEGLPLTFLDHRFVVGDSLTGPFFEHLIKYPGTQEVMEDLFTEGLQERLSRTLNNALRNVDDLEAGVGISLSELEAKKAAKERLDRGLAPFRIIAAAWAGGVMHGREQCDDQAYADLVRHVAEKGDLPESLVDMPRLAAMIAKGLGVEEIPAERQDLLNAILSPVLVSAFPYELAFPEVFYPEGQLSDRRGFHAVVGNPPWERIEIDPIAFFGQIDFSVIEETNPRRRRDMITTLLENETWQAQWADVSQHTEQDMRLADALYHHQVVVVEGRSTLGRPDTYRLFVERFLALAGTEGMVSWVVPSSFHSNEGATGVRRLYRRQSRIAFCYSFENKKKLFEIDSRQKYCLFLAQKHPAHQQEFKAAFYLHDPEWLFSDNRGDRELAFTDEIIELTGGPHETYIEARTHKDLELLTAQYCAAKADWSDLLTNAGIVTAFGVELHRNPAFNKTFERPATASDLFIEARSRGWEWLPIHAGKTIFQYTDEGEYPCTNFVMTEDAVTTRHWKHSVPYYRFAFRMKAASTNERTMIAVILTPGFVNEQTLAAETNPSARPNLQPLFVMALANSCCFDWQVRQRVTTSLSNYLLAPIPVPDLAPCQVFFVHSALRLICNHEGYAPLWQEQIGNAWREDRPTFAWPVLEGSGNRWSIRAAVDVVVAEAYGLSRDQYAHVLSSFSHRSYPKAPDLCIDRFDELKTIGLEAFTKKYDPYWDIPLNENLPKPVVDIPMGEAAEDKDHPELSLDLESPDVMGQGPSRTKRKGRRR